MSNEKPKNRLINQIIVALVVAAVTGGSAPFWWKHVFKPPNMNIHGAWQTNVPHLGYEIDQTGKKYT